MNWKSSLAVLFALAGASFASGALEFAGYMITSQEARFNIVDPEQKQSSRWLKLGQSFQGHTLADFDPEKEVLSLKSAAG